MANGASRIFDIIKDTSEKDKITTELVTLYVKSLNPLVFKLDEKTDITEDFYELDINFNTAILHVGDAVKALVLNNNQLYYFIGNVDVSSIETDITELTDRVDNLEDDVENINNDINNINTNKVIKDFGTINFQAVDNQKVKITIPITTSAVYLSKLIVRLQSNYDSANYQGCLEKTFSFVSTSSNIFGGGSAEYTYIGNNADAFAISDVDLVNSNIEIIIAFQSNKMTSAKLMIEAYYSSNGTKPCIENATLSDIYTTDTTVLPTPTYGFNKIVVPKMGLQGYFNSSSNYILPNNIYLLPFINWHHFLDAANADEYIKEMLKWICVNYPGVTHGTWIGSMNPGSQGTAIFNIYSTSVKDANTGLPQYSNVLYTIPGGGTQSAGTYQYIYRELHHHLVPTNTNKDLNTLIMSGLYYCNAGCANRPIEINGYLLVLASSANPTTYCTQLYIPNSTSTIRFTRNLVSGTWEPWTHEGEASGTWTPTINTRENVAPTVTYTTQKGTYKKVGSMVFIDFYIRGRITALNGTNNYGVIRGLPFVPKAYTLGQCALSLGECYNIGATANTICLDVVASYNGEIYLQSNNGASAMILNTNSSSTSTSYFIIAGSGWYEATQ